MTHPTLRETLSNLIAVMRRASENCMNSHDAGFVIDAAKADDWADELEQALATPSPGPRTVLGEDGGIYELHTSTGLSESMPVTLEQPSEKSLRLRHALQGILEIGKRDTSNPKYDGYFEEARLAIRSFDEPSVRPAKGVNCATKRCAILRRIWHTLLWVGTRGRCS